MRRTLRTIALLGAATLGFAGSAHAATPTITEYLVGNNTEPGGIAQGPSGHLWSTLTGSAFRRIIYTDAASGQIVLYTSPFANNETPVNIAAGPDGKMWAGRINGVSGQNTVVQLVDSSTTNLVPFQAPTIVALTAGPERKMWIASRGKVAKVDTAAPTNANSTTNIALSGTTDNIGGITAGPDGNLWFLNQTANKVGRILRSASDSSGIAQYSLLTSDANPSSIATGPEGDLWFTETGADKIGRVTTGGVVQEFALPTDGDPGGITAGPDGNLWFTEPGANKIGRITPTGTVTEYPVPSGASPLRIAAGPDGNLWFTAVATTGTNPPGYIGRITTEVDPPGFSNTTRILVPSAGAATPSPSPIAVSGLQGTVTGVTVRLNGVHHSFAPDLRVQLEGPQGQSVVLLDRPSRPEIADGAVMTFADGGRAVPGRLVSGIFKPVGSTPVPGAPQNPSANLSVFNGTNPNGQWKLHVYDRSGGDFGSIGGGWSLDVKTTGPPKPPSQGGGGGQTSGGQTGGGVLPSGGPSASVFTPRDTTKPKLKLAKLASKTTLARFRKGLSVGVTPSESATLKCTLATVAKKPKTLATATKKSGKATTCKLKPSKKKLGKPKKAFKVKVTIAATDAAGNKGTTSKTITVKP